MEALSQNYCNEVPSSFAFHKATRKGFFSSVANLLPKIDAEIVVLTHLLEDRPEFLETLNSIAPVSLVISIPYSTNAMVKETLKRDYSIFTPTLKQLNNPIFISDLLVKNIGKNRSVIIIEIGGYFSQALNLISRCIGSRLVGVIEDTQAGYRRYLSVQASLPCSVVSVARSSLKLGEDGLIGQSCVFSIEKILRNFGSLLNNKSLLVIGYGNIGSGVALSLNRRGCSTSVYDVDPIKMLHAAAQGYQVLAKDDALKQADIVFGCTGHLSLTANDMAELRSGAILVSCSSRDIEFDLEYLTKNYKKISYSNHLVKYENDKQIIYLVANGRPVNFIDGAVVGPALSVVQAEMILAIKTLIKLYSKGMTGIYETSISDKKKLAQIWLEAFYEINFGG